MAEKNLGEPDSAEGESPPEVVLKSYHPAPPVVINGQGFHYHPMAAARGFLPDRDSPPESAPAERRFESLPPLLRALLVTDGTITKLLEAFLWEPIRVRLLGHSEREVGAPEARTHLAMTEGERLIERTTLVVGAQTGRPYLAAVSHICIDRLDDNIREDLFAGVMGIGEALRARRLETYREILSLRVTTAGRWAEALECDETARAFSRQYRIFMHGKPVILIDETFHEERFKAAAAR